LPYLAETTLPSDCVGSLLTECLSFAGLPDVTLVPSEFLACVEAFDALSCDDWLYGGLFFRCEGLSGTRPDGSACGSPLQCASGACSVNLGCGVCETPSTEGESCAERQCATGLECGPGAICFEPRFLGDPCSDDAPCTQVLTCVGGACAKRGSEGTPCAGGALECDLLQGLTCGENLRCEPIAIPGIGEACTGFCATGAACDATGRCVPALMNGERCSLDGSGFNLCDDSLECIDGVCAQFDPASCG
jgi:hypothetical protein